MNRVHNPFIKNLKPIGFLNGQPIFPIMGGSGEGDESQRGKEDADSDDDEEDDDDDQNSDSGEDGAKKKDQQDDDEDDSEAEKFRKRMKAADRRASTAETELKKLKDAQKDDVQRATDEAKEAKDSLESMTTEVSSLRLENAFLKANKITWHNAGTALSIAQAQGYLEDVADEDSGEIDTKALASALSKLAKEQEYLVKKSHKNGDDGEGGSSGERGPEGNSGNSKDEKARKQEIRRRLPALGKR